MSLTLRSGLAFAVFCASGLCPQASVFPQQESGGAIETQPAVLTVPGSPADFEVKRIPGKGLLVRRKGTLEWTPNSKFSEPIAVGALDADHKIYLVPSKAIRPPEARHQPDPIFPDSERKSGKEGRVYLHFVVDDQGAVHFPTVDEASSPEFAQSAVEAVKKWMFKPAQLNGQPVAVLITVDLSFKLYKSF